jgi:hypothetical protein
VYFVLPFQVVLHVEAAVRKNPIAKNTTTKTLQCVTAKWLYGSRDRDGGHKERMRNARNRSEVNNAAAGQSRHNNATATDSDN